MTTVVGDQRDHAAVAGEQGLLLADEAWRLHTRGGRERAGRHDSPGRWPERRTPPAEAAVLRVQLRTTVRHVYGQDIWRSGLWPLPRGPLRRARGTAGQETGAVNAPRVAGG